MHSRRERRRRETRLHEGDDEGVLKLGVAAGDGAGAEAVHHEAQGAAAGLESRGQEGGEDSAACFLRQAPGQGSAASSCAACRRTLLLRHHERPVNAPGCSRSCGTALATPRC